MFEPVRVLDQFSWQDHLFIKGSNWPAHLADRTGHWAKVKIHSPAHCPFSPLPTTGWCFRQAECSQPRRAFTQTAHFPESLSPFTACFINPAYHLAASAQHWNFFFVSERHVHRRAGLCQKRARGEGRHKNTAHPPAFPCALLSKI